MRQVQIETEQEDDISKEVLEENRNVLYKKELDHLILENYYKSQLPSKTYQEKLKLDNTLQYVSKYLNILHKTLRTISYSDFMFADTYLYAFANILFKTYLNAKTYSLGQKMKLTYGI